MHDPYTFVRCNAIKALEHFRDERAFPAVVEALKDPSPKVRDRAVVALGHFRDPRALAPIKESFAKSFEDREHCVDAVAEMGGPQALSPTAASGPSAKRCRGATALHSAPSPGTARKPYPAQFVRQRMTRERQCAFLPA